MASQDDTAGLSTIQGSDYPNYEDEEGESESSNDIGREFDNKTFVD